MKMPTRPWYPPMQPQTDIFGLAHITLLGAAFETPQQRRQRVSKVELGVKKAFNSAVRHLGEDAARELFIKMTRLPKRGRGKALAPDRDARILCAYDSAPKGESINAIARRLRSEGTELGNTVGAIAKQIRKLVEERRVQEHRSRVETRRWRMAMRNEPPTLRCAPASSAYTPPSNLVRTGPSGALVDRLRCQPALPLGHYETPAICTQFAYARAVFKADRSNGVLTVIGVCARTTRSMPSPPRWRLAPAAAKRRPDEATVCIEYFAPTHYMLCSEPNLDTKARCPGGIAPWPHVSLT
jgi:hypothetical protein